jgi:hypothetical protein
MSNIHFDENSETLYEIVYNKIYKIESDIFRGMSHIVSDKATKRVIIPSTSNGMCLKGIFWDMNEERNDYTKICYDIDGDDKCIMEMEDIYYRSVKQHRGLYKMTQQPLCFIGFSKSSFDYNSTILLVKEFDVVIQRSNDIPFNYVAIY